MSSATYFILATDGRDMIVHAETGLRVHVFSLENVGFTPSPGELHIFGDDHGEWLAFETDGYTGEDLDLVKGAVFWYAHYLDYPEMDICTEDPRSSVKLKKI